MNAISDAFAGARDTVAKLEAERDQREPLIMDADALTVFAAILDLLDAAAAMQSYLLLTLFAERYPEGVAEHALRTWAGSRNLPVVEHVSHYDGKSIRVLEIQLGPHGTDGVIGLQWGPR